MAKSLKHSIFLTPSDEPAEEAVVVVVDLYLFLYLFFSLLYTLVFAHTEFIGFEEASAIALLAFLCLIPQALQSDCTTKMLHVNKFMFKVKHFCTVVVLKSC